MIPTASSKTKSFRKWLRFLLVLVLLCGGVWLLQVCQPVDKPQLVSTQGRFFEKATVTSIVQDNLQEDGSRVGDQIVMLQLKDGSTVEANCPNGLLFGTVAQPGMSVIVISSTVGQLSLHTVYNVDRTWPVYGFIAVFLALLRLIGGRKGVASAVALVLTFSCFIGFFFPMILRGMPPILAALVTAAVILGATLYLLNGWSAKSGAAFAATIGGIVIACLSAVIFCQIAHLSGYNVSNIENLMFVAQNTLIDVGQFLFAGILFASLGAVMDIAMDVTSAYSELVRHQPDLTRQQIFQAGMNVGRDVMGTMAATLILAFFGGSLGVWVLDYAYDLPYLQLINSNAVCIELMKGLSGSFGVIFTVPLAALCSAWLYGRKKGVSEKQ